MSDPCQSCGPLLRALEQRVLDRFEAVEQRAAAATATSTREVDLARQEMDRRLEGMNGLKAELNRVQSTFITRPEHDNLTQQLNAVVQRVAGIVAPETSTRYVIAVLIAILIGVGGYWLSTLESRVDTLRARQVDNERKITENTTNIDWLSQGRHP